ncbi:MAG: DUF456 domain-containing protein [Candidatus Nanohaloarchaea archaeon]
MIEFFTVAAVLLMVLAVAGSFTPMVPGALLSIIGLGVYWYSTGFTRPDAWFLAAFTLTGLFAVATDYLSGIIAARMGGATTRNSAIAGIAGFLLFLALGPLGILLGVAGTVLALEYRRTADSRGSIKAAGYASIGVLGSTAVQFVITVSLLLAFITALLV